jgi:hypothetical protein
VEKYKVNSILSILSERNGKEKEAKYYAALAEQSANAETSGLRYHKTLGLVTENDLGLRN